MGLLSFFISSHLIQGTVHAQIEVPSDSFQVFVKLFGRSFQFLRQFRNRAVLLITALQDLLIFGGDLANACCQRLTAVLQPGFGLNLVFGQGFDQVFGEGKPVTSRPLPVIQDFKMYESTSPSVKGTTRIIIFVLLPQRYGSPLKHVFGITCMRH